MVTDNSPLDCRGDGDGVGEFPTRGAAVGTWLGDLLLLGGAVAEAWRRFEDGIVTARQQPLFLGIVLRIAPLAVSQKTKCKFERLK